MASTPGAQKNKQAQTQNEGPIASRLRSKTKIGDAQTSNTETIEGTHVKKSKSSDKPSQNSRHHQNDNKSNNSAAKKGEVLHTLSTNIAPQPSRTDTNNNKCAKKTNDSPPPKITEDKASSSCRTITTSNDHRHGTNKMIIKDSTSDEAKRKQDSKKQNAKSISDRTNQNSSKNIHERPKKSNSPRPSSSNNSQKSKPSQKLATNSSFKDHPLYYIRRKVFDDTSTTGCNCALCEKDLACLPDTDEYMEESSSDDDDEEEYELENLFTSQAGLELEQHSMLPEVSVLPCTHAFHTMCLTLTDMDPTDSPCPICISLL